MRRKLRQEIALGLWDRPYSDRTLLPQVGSDAHRQVGARGGVPTSRLSHSWPREMAQVPINWGDAVYDPLYAYGYGLSY